MPFVAYNINMWIISGILKEILKEIIQKRLNYNFKEFALRNFRSFSIVA